MSDEQRCLACGNTRDMGCPEAGDWTYCPHPAEPSPDGSGKRVGAREWPSAAAQARSAFLAGVEFGFIMGEKGHNLDKALIEARKAVPR